jgi:hypothetical protein
MESGEEFVGFDEAPINFPPTFKYDVLRTLKGHKKRSFGANWKHSAERAKQLSEVEETEHHKFDEEDIEEDGEGGEATSLSSAWTSVCLHADVGDDYYFDKSPDPGGAIGAPQKFAIGFAALKAKSKWLALLSPSLPSIQTGQISRKRGSSHGRIGTSASATDLPSSQITDDLSPSRGHKSTSLRSPSLQPPETPTKSKSSLTRSDEGEDDNKGVYDSSYKKRVPSW